MVEEEKSPACKRISQTKYIATLGILTAMSIILVHFIHFPIVPAAPFLEYDAADVPVLIGGFALGPVAGALLSIIVSVIQGITVSAASGVYGIIMHCLATGTFVMTATFIYYRKKNRNVAYIALAAGIVAMTLIMIPANYVVTPIFLGVTRQAVTVILPYIILFNLLKGCINALITILLYKKIANYINGL